MKFGRLIKIGIIVVLVLVGITYATYATSYKDNYNLNISFVASVPESGVIAVTDFEYYSEPTEVMSFWSELKGRGDPVTGIYQMYAEFNQSGDIETKVVDVELDTAILDQVVDYVDVSFWFMNKDPGQATVRIYVIYEYTNSMIYDKTYPVVVG